MRNGEVLDFEDFMWRYLQDGFTLECLSRACDTPVEFLQEYTPGGCSETKNRKDLPWVFNFIVTLYCNGFYEEEEHMLKEYMKSICGLYAIPERALAKYLKMEEGEFKAFLDDPESYPGGFRYALKLMFALSLFSRVKKE
ncbi:hypothetical protein MKC73_17795 [[Clostridium] innocuum]|nr:hypothetical protein [[Clostridium] innocuum]